MRRPWFAFYVDDFETSGRVKLMTNAEKGCYLTLMIYQWREGWVPSEVVDLARICVEPPSVFKRYWKRLESHFPVGEDGKRRNARIQTETQKAEEVSNRNRTNVGRRYPSGSEVVGGMVDESKPSGREVEGSAVIHKSQPTSHTSQEAYVISSEERQRRAAKQQIIDIGKRAHG